jgi:tetratricopeptide (TPR) repeat protein
MMRVSPRAQHFAYFYAESCKEEGRYKEAIDIWWQWLHLFAAADEYGWHEFTPATIVDNLRAVLTFDLEPQEIIDAWERSLQNYPWMIYDDDDPRRQCLASMIVDSAKIEDNNLWRRAAELCPENDEIVAQVRRNFGTTSRLEQRLWESLISESTNYRTTVPEFWYRARLAQFHFSRLEYEDLRSCLNEMADKAEKAGRSLAGMSKVLQGLNVGWPAVDFWVSRVEASPWDLSIWQLEAVCNSSTFASDNFDVTGMWQSLLMKHPSNGQLYEALLTVFRTQISGHPEKVLEMIGVLSDCIRSRRGSPGACDDLADACKWKRENSGSVSYTPPTTAFDDEINTWNNLILGLSELSGFGHHSALYYLATAIQRKADAIRNVTPPPLRQLEVVSWKYAINIWRHISAIFPDAPSDAMSIIRKNLDGADAIVRLLEGDTLFGRVFMMSDLILMIVRIRFKAYYGRLYKLGGVPTGNLSVIQSLKRNRLLSPEMLRICHHLYISYFLQSFLETLFSSSHSK